MKIQSVRFNNRSRAFEIEAGRGKLLFPYAKADPAPTHEDPVVEVFLDEELGREAVAYRLASGREGMLHVEQALEYNKDPDYMRDLLLYRMTLEAQKRMAECPLSKREVIRRLKTSPAQFYRLLDSTNYSKSMDKLLMLLHILDCEVDLVVRAKSA